MEDLRFFEQIIGGRTQEEEDILYDIQKAEDLWKNLDKFKKEMDAPDIKNNNYLQHLMGMVNVVSISTGAYVAASLYRMHQVTDQVLHIRQIYGNTFLVSLKSIQRYILNPAYATEAVKLAKFGICLQSVLATLNMALTLKDLCQTIDYIRNINSVEYDSEIINLQEGIDTAAEKIAKTCEQLAKNVQPTYSLTALTVDLQSLRGRVNQLVMELKLQKIRLDWEKQVAIADVWRNGIVTVVSTVSAGATIAMAPPLGVALTVAACLPPAMSAAATGMSVYKLVSVIEILATVEQLLKSAYRLLEKIEGNNKKFQEYLLKLKRQVEAKKSD